MLKSDNIFVTSESLNLDDGEKSKKNKHTKNNLKIHNLSKSSLRIGRIAESIKTFFQSNNSTRSFLDCFPDNPIGLGMVSASAIMILKTHPLPKSLANLKFSHNMTLDLFGHLKKCVAHCTHNLSNGMSVRL
jgi:hypothetical protein